MKKLMVISMLVVAGLLFAPSAAQAVVLESFEGDTTNWTGVWATASLSTDQYYLGSKSLKVTSDGIADTSNHFIAHNSQVDNYGDQSALKTTYVEFAFRVEPIADFGTGNPNWLDASSNSTSAQARSIMLYLGSSSTSREGWYIDTNNGVFEDIAPVNGWYVVHFELDDNGKATDAGATLNGISIGSTGGNPDSVKGWSSGTVDWTNLDFVRLHIYTADESVQRTIYIDQLTLGEAVPEPATMVLLGLGGVGLLIRRRRRA